MMSPPSHLIAVKLASTDTARQVNLAFSSKLVVLLILSFEEGVWLTARNTSSRSDSEIQTLRYLLSYWITLSPRRNLYSKRFLTRTINVPYWVRQDWPSIRYYAISSQTI